MLWVKRGHVKTFRCSQTVDRRDVQRETVMQALRLQCSKEMEGDETGMKPADLPWLGTAGASSGGQCEVWKGDVRAHLCLVSDRCRFRAPIHMYARTNTLHTISAQGTRECHVKVCEGILCIVDLFPGSLQHTAAAACCMPFAYHSCKGAGLRPWQRPCLRHEQA